MNKQSNFFAFFQRHLTWHKICMSLALCTVIAQPAVVQSQDHKTSPTPAATATSSNSETKHPSGEAENLY